MGLLDGKPVSISIRVSRYLDLLLAGKRRAFLKHSHRIRRGVLVIACASIIFSAENKYNIFPSTNERNELHRQTPL